VVCAQVVEARADPDATGGGAREQGQDLVEVLVGFAVHDADLEIGQSAPGRVDVEARRPRVVTLCRVTSDAMPRCTREHRQRR